MRYRQHKPNGEVFQADWLRNFPKRKLNSWGLYGIGKSRWEIQNQGFNDGKNRYGMEHIRHHEPNSSVVNWRRCALARTSGSGAIQLLLHEDFLLRPLQ